MFQPILQVISNKVCLCK